MNSNRTSPSTVTASAQAYDRLAIFCFERVWKLAGQENRTPEDDRLMLAESEACLSHWAQSASADGRRMVAAHSQASLIHGLVGDVRGALEHARSAMAFAPGLGPTYLGYAVEALVRAEAMARRADASDPQVGAPTPNGLITRVSNVAQTAHL